MPVKGSDRIVLFEPPSEILATGRSDVFLGRESEGDNHSSSEEHQLERRIYHHREILYQNKGDQNRSNPPKSGWCNEVMGQ